ncbi:CPBP family intramembrane glutamic endopeptidase [Cytobacillus sp. FJAT-54145]|uniref:CPBP family intramembrane glutamic endopeptidase n=1 Tax=Cytobacillus spartinae TaxID=3299023 RepID=A0ABW6KBD8_9BACI
METRLIVTIITLIVLLEGFIIYLFIKYKQGKIDENPLRSITNKEWKMIYYAFFKWKKRELPDGVDSFSIHKNSNYFWLFIALLHEQVLEAIFFHFWFKQDYPSIAYIMTGLHVYSILYMLGDYNWVRNTPVVVKKNFVTMQVGARRKLSFHIRNIQTIQKATIKYDKSGGIIHERDVFHLTALPRLFTRIFGISDELKYEIIFENPLEATGYFGTKKKVTKAFIYLDEADQFVDLLNDRKEHLLDENDEEIVEVDTRKVEKQQLFNWKLYSILLAINVVGALALTPYAIARGNYHEEMGIPKLLFSVIFIGQVVLEAAIFIFLALWMANRVKVRIPIIKSLLDKKNAFLLYRNQIASSVALGVITGIIILITSYFVSKPLGIDNSSINEPAWWVSTLGSIGAATTEETMLRLFLITLIIWMFVKFSKKAPTKFTKWFAISLSSLIFGVLHFGVASSSFEMTIGLFAAMLLINGIGGMVFGALFVFAGLEFAMISHFMADVVIHVIAPLFI